MDNLLWIGYSTQLYPMKVELKLALNREVDEALDAKTGLEYAVKPYPLILVNDTVPAGRLELPEGISPEMTEEISCLVLQALKKMKNGTPIIVTSTGYVEKFKYYKAGATDVCNKSLSDIRETVVRYLPISASLLEKT